MGHKVMDGDGTMRGLCRCQGMAVALPDPGIGKLRQKIGKRLIQLERPFFVQHQGGQGCHWLGHGIDAPDRIRRHRCAGLCVSVADLP